MKHTLIGLALSVFLMGCATETSRETETPAADTAATNMGATARADLKDKDGNSIGSATFQQMGGGVQISLNARGLTQGEHGFHIHETGTCEPPEFTSAGGHWNPTNKEHGKEVPGGPHMGDLLNLEVGQDGNADTTRMIDGATIGEGQTSVLGKAVVIHAQADDYKSQPSGDAGGRVACGVIQQQ